MMRVLLFAVLIFFIACGETPQDPEPSIHGKIVGFVMEGQSLTAIGGANIHTNPPTGVVTTDTLGAYQIEHILPGTYRVYANKLGYDTASVGIAIQAGITTNADIVLLADSLKN
jgi:hypothetical protein